MRTHLGALLLCLAACSRGGELDEAEDLAGALDLRAAADLAPAAGPDLTTPPDLLPAGKDEVLASGPFTKGGTASLVRRASGALELQFSAAFFVDGQACPSAPPDPYSVVLLSVREEIPMYDARFELEVGQLQAFTGAQTFRLKDMDPVGRPFVHVFCRPNPMTPLKQFTMSRAVVRVP